MATSSITYNPSLDVFEQRQIDASVEEISYTETKPQTAIDQQGPHIFEVPASQNPIDLQNVLLNIECKIAKTDVRILVLPSRSALSTTPCTRSLARWRYDWEILQYRIRIRFILIKLTLRNCCTPTHQNSTDVCECKGAYSTQEENLHSQIPKQIRITAV